MKIHSNEFKKEYDLSKA